MSNSLDIAKTYNENTHNLLVPMHTVSEISDIQKPVMNVVKISTNLNDKEIYEQEKAREAWTDSYNKYHSAEPPKYALTKKGLTKLMRAAGIKILSSRPVVPSTCQKCTSMNAAIRKPVCCGSCPNKDVKYECRISVPQLTGEDMEVVAHKEIIVDDVTAYMKPKQKEEFLKFRCEMCESKALNRALRTAMQIKPTYLLQEFDKPFVVAYLVPNLDNPDVKAEAVKHFFPSAKELYSDSSLRIKSTVYLDDEQEESRIEPDNNSENGFDYYQAEDTQQQPNIDNLCSACGILIKSEKVIEFSRKKYGCSLCMSCQKERR